MTVKLRRNRGAALILALVIISILTLLGGAALYLTLASHGLAWAESRSEAALHVAEGGLNDELRYISQHVGDPAATTVSHQPIVYDGETMVSPFTNAVVKGKRGTITGLAQGNFWVYASADAAGTQPWDGISQYFYITSTGYVAGSWKRVQVKAQALSAFGEGMDAIVALAAYPNNANAIQLQNATVSVVGRALTNGQVSNSSSTLVATNAINADTDRYSTGQFDLTNIAAGGTLISQAKPVVYPTVTTLLSRMGLTWTSLAAANSNSTGIYTFKSNVNNPIPANVSRTNCQTYNPGMTMLTNQTTGSYQDTWSSATRTNKPNGAFLAVSTKASGTNIEVIADSSTVNAGDRVYISGLTGPTNANCTAANPYWTVLSANGARFVINAAAAVGEAGSNGSGQVLVALSTISVNTTPIAVTTSSNHGLSTGSSVTFIGTGDSNLDGRTWGITVTGNTTFTLNSSASLNEASPGIVSGGFVRPKSLKTLIFEPGDYYFSTIAIANDPSTQIIIDPYAYASGGTPGLVRFWVNNPAATGNQNDYVQVPIKFTLAPAMTSGDPTKFRIYYGQDGGVFTFQRPTNFVDFSGSPSFVTYGAVYAVTKPPGDTSALHGTEIDFVGIGGSVGLVGALVADQIAFHYQCFVQYLNAGNTNDPPAGASAIGGYTEG